MLKKVERRIGYVDAVNFDHHIGEDINPTEIFSSLELCLEGQKCSNVCGVVEVEVRKIKYAKQPVPYSKQKRLTAKQLHKMQIKEVRKRIKKEEQQLKESKKFLAKLLSEKL